MTFNNSFNNSSEKNSPHLYITLYSDQDLKENIHLPENFKNEIKVLDSNNLDQLLNQLLDKLPYLKSNITELKIGINDIAHLDKILCDENNKYKSCFHKNMIKLMSIEIIDFQNLNVLNLSHCELSNLPDNLSILKNLELLNVSHNKLKNLPDSYVKLQRLKYLDISDNKLQIIPKCISDGMATLNHLDISKNLHIKMNIIPYSKYLEIFYAKENKKCGSFPDWLLTPKFFNLKEFNLDGTSFDLFSFVGKDGDLCITSFSMCSANLTSEILEEMIKNMIKVEKINVSNLKEFSYGNMFNDIPIHALKNPCLIKELNFSKTSLSSVPTIINQFINLKQLDLSYNCISWFPEEICELCNLEYLIISGNELIMLPQNIGNLKLLTELKADNNFIRRLPNSFKNLKNLRFLDLYNNKFEEFPDVLCKLDSLQGLDLELNYVSTVNIKINKISYTTFYKTYASFETSPDFQRRISGVKEESSSTSEDYNSCSASSCVSDEEQNENVPASNNDEIEENWDSMIDTDDEFEPGLIRNYNDLSKEYILDVSNGFCPADLHSKKIFAEVSNMREYGSLPNFVIEQGQFDDA